VATTTHRSGVKRGIIAMQKLRSDALAIPAVLATLALSASVATAQETPRTADGHPDLSGYWLPINAVVRDSTDDAGNIDFTLPARNNDIGNFEKDFAVLERAKPNKPLYKPEYWDRIQDLDWNGLTADPIFDCRPAGVPRQGPPHKIVQTPTEIVFLYERRGNIGPAMFRVIPTDGREHLPAQINDTSWHGYGIGHWEGDTLVVESVGFNDESWIGWAGAHSPRGQRHPLGSDRRGPGVFARAVDTRPGSHAAEHRPERVLLRRDTVRRARRRAHGRA
jgi:hypothetical protein